MNEHAKNIARFPGAAPLLRPVGETVPVAERSDEELMLAHGEGDEAAFDGVLIRVDQPEEVFGVVDDVKALGLTAKGAFQQIESVNQLMDVVVLILAFFAGVSLIVGVGLALSTGG